MILIVAGTRPNFIKVAPLIRELSKAGAKYKVVNTGQHYDANMSDLFFIRPPDIALNVGKGTQIEQAAKIMKKFDKICRTEKPSMVIVVGDVTSTAAAALVACKIPGIKLVHIESGGRSFNRDMPEETNRVITDVLSDYLFAVIPEHVDNLLREGISPTKIHLVGDNIIDNLLYTRTSTKKVRGRVLVTIHRQSNTDDLTNLVGILRALDTLGERYDVRFPIHPRTRNVICKRNLKDLLENVDTFPPLGYSDFVREMDSAEVILTDSGGATMEAAVLGVPCVVIREEIERKFLVEENLSKLVGTDTDEIVKSVDNAVKNGPVAISSKWSDLFDGNASKRIVKILKEKGEI